MRFWQQAMIGLARSEGVTRFMEGNPLMHRFSRQFVCGEDCESGLASARALRDRNIDVSMFFLGEYVEDEELVRRNVRALEEVIPGLEREGLDVHVSVDPTQAGSMIDWNICRDHTLSLARQVAGCSGCDAQGPDKASRNVVMLDMEDSSVTQNTLDLYHDLRSLELPAAVTIQAYLYRSHEDLKQLVRRGAMVRLVKGAFAEPASQAFTARRDIDAAYKRGLKQLFSPEAREKGVYPVLGTHDHRMIAHASALAGENGWQCHEWEIEMLYGVRPAYQNRLVEQGYRLRLYAPFGKSWWPYSIRRVGESWKNLLFVLRSVVGR